MRRWILVLALALTACGPTLEEHLSRVRSDCASLGGPSTVEAVRVCQDRQRATFAAYEERPGPFTESLWAFERLVAQKLDAGAISPDEAIFAVRDYRRRLEVEARHVQAAEQSARQAELGNYLSVWRAYFGDR